jgi:hypothetical protein
MIVDSAGRPLGSARQGETASLPSATAWRCVRLYFFTLLYPAVAPRYQHRCRDNAEQVVTGARLAPNPWRTNAGGRFFFDKPVFARLLPQYLHVEIEQLTSDEAMKPDDF